VPSFDLDANLAEDRAYRLAANGAVTMFRRPAVLDETVAWLADHGYLIHRWDAGSWATQADFHAAVKQELDFPDYYGQGSLDGFDDCLRDVATYDYGASRDATGTILVFTGYDTYAAREPRAAQVILDVIADTARLAMLFGHRMLCLVQSDDPDITFEPVGATAVSWAERR
jgi:hypothetical protein